MPTAVELIDQAIDLIDKLLPKEDAKTDKAAAVPVKQPELKTASVPAAPAKVQAAPAKVQAAPAKVQAAPAPVDDASLFSKALLKVAKVLSVSQLANSEKLYKLSVDVGNGETKQVCAGLKQFISADALSGSLVAVVLNLKPAKLAGEVSEAMILAADALAADGSTLVRTVVPPKGCEPGDVLFVEGGAPTETPVKQLKSDDWKKIVERLSVQGARACYAGRSLCTARGPITLPGDIPDGSGIH